MGEFLIIAGLSGRGGRPAGGHVRGPGLLRHRQPAAGADRQGGRAGGPAGVGDRAGGPGGGAGRRGSGRRAGRRRSSSCARAATGCASCSSRRRPRCWCAVSRAPAGGTRWRARGWPGQHLARAHPDAAHRHMADVVVDTTELNVHQLRDRLLDLFSRDDPAASMRTSIVSFGYKHGVPLDADLVLDCRFLPNPHWVDELRPFTGLDDAGARLRHGAARDGRVPRQARRAARAAPARLRAGGQVVPHHRRRLHRRPAPLGGAGRGDRPLHRGPRLPPDRAPPRRA